MNQKRIALAGAGIVAVAALALGGAALASADESGTATSTSPGGTYSLAPGGPSNSNTDPSKPMRSDEKLLTGDTAAKVTAAARAKEPGATIERVETDSDGVYEAHMVRADGTHIIVQIDASFAVTNVQEGGAGGHGGPGMGQGQGGGTSGETPSSGTTPPASTATSAT